MEILVDPAYWALFWGTFLAATLIPFSSEAMLSAMLLGHYPAEWVILFATLGNTAGGMSGFALGYFGRVNAIQKWLKISKEKLLRWEQKTQRYGAWLAFLTWMPFLGDPLSVALGFFKVSPWKCFVFSLLGKGLRYIVWAYIHYKGMELF